MPTKKAQGATEYLLILAGAILVAAILLALLASMTKPIINEAETGLDKVFDALPGCDQAEGDDCDNDGTCQTLYDPDYVCNSLCECELPPDPCAGETCGNETCNSACGEDTATCPADCPVGPSYTFELSAVSSLEKLRNTAGPYADLSLLQTETPEAQISSAKNEHESFQLIIKATDDYTEDCVESSEKCLFVESVTIPAGLTGPGGATIQSSNFEFFYEYFIEVTTPTNPGYNFKNSLGTGYYADGLPPLNNSFEIIKNQNQPIWVKVYVPAGTPAGDYTGEIIVTTSNAGIKTIPVNLHVWNFALTDTETLDMVFGLGDTHLAGFYGWPGPPLIEPAKTAKVNDYVIFMLENRVVPFSGGVKHIIPSKSLDGSEVVVNFTSEQKNYLQTYMSYNPRIWQFPIGTWTATQSLINDYTIDDQEFKDRMTEYVEKVIAEYQALELWNGQEYFTWIIDEPNTAEDYATVNKWSLIVDNANPNSKFMITEQITPDYSPPLSNIDIWSPTAKVFVINEGHDASIYNNTNEYWWWYNTGETIDVTSTNTRVLMWYNYMWEIDGFMDWATTWWGNATHNPWTNPKTFDETGGSGPGFPNGSGYFFYPGTMIDEHTQMNDETNDVITSIRWQLFMDAIDDHAYLTMADSSVSDNAVNMITVGGIDYTENFTTWGNARTLLAEDIEP